MMQRKTNGVAKGSNKPHLCKNQEVHNALAKVTNWKTKEISEPASIKGPKKCRHGRWSVRQIIKAPQDPLFRGILERYSFMNAERYEDYCEITEDIIMRSLDPDLFHVDSSEKELAERHLKNCPECRAFNELMIKQRITAAIADVLYESSGPGDGPKPSSPTKRFLDRGT